MSRIGVFSPPWVGHLNPNSSLAFELAKRGHEVIFFTLPDFADDIRLRGLHVEVFGEKACPSGTLPERFRQMSQLEGLAASRAGLDIFQTQAEALFSEGPAVIAAAKLDLWVVDQMDYSAATLAARLGAPFVSTFCGLIRKHEDGVPGFSGEPYSDDPEVQERDRRFEERLLQTSQPFRDYLNEYRLREGMSPFSYDHLWSGLAQISQQPAEFEFPRRALPAWFHFTGPFSDRDHRPSAPLPPEIRPGKPLIYAAFGTTQNRNLRLYEAVASAVADLDVQVVLSMGGAEPIDLPEKPVNALLVSFVSQLAILERAALMITHAGMNSALECLQAGVPMVAIPIAHDHLGVAARIEWTRTGVRIPMAECEPARVHEAIQTVLGDPSFRESAQRFKRIIAERDGLRRACSIIEEVLVTGRPVLR